VGGLLAGRAWPSAKHVLPLAFAALLAATLLVAGWSTRTQSAATVYLSVRPPAPHVTKNQPKPGHPFGVLVGWARVSSLPISAAAGGRPSQSLPNPNNLGAPLAVLVNELHGKWAQVYLPERPNESLGWTPASDLSMQWNPERIVVSLSKRHLELLRDGRVVFQATAAVGNPESPTPTGFFYVTEVLKLTDPGDVYGPYALGLSGFSNTYYSFDGGPGQIAIHGTNEPSVIGQYASHGCVRLDNPDITTLSTQVEAGTPVDITP
jgi:lipoprotein-anchoring transpeptidase ErfK/SrfK